MKNRSTKSNLFTFIILFIVAIAILVFVPDSVSLKPLIFILGVTFSAAISSAYFDRKFPKV